MAVSGTTVLSSLEESNSSQTVCSLHTLHWTTKVNKKDKCLTDAMVDLLFKTTPISLTLSIVMKRKTPKFKSTVSFRKNKQSNMQLTTPIVLEDYQPCIEAKLRQFGSMMVRNFGAVVTKIS